MHELTLHNLPERLDGIDSITNIELESLGIDYEWDYHYHPATGMFESAHLRRTTAEAVLNVTLNLELSSGELFRRLNMMAEYGFSYDVEETTNPNIVIVKIRKTQYS